jgi:outer membrane protein
LLAPGFVHAGSVLDYIRDHDLNDYALGLMVSGEQNPYAGAKNSSLAYPYLTSFRDSVFTDTWLIIRDGDIGMRWVSENGWELGGVGRVQTLGLGSSETDELLGIADRKWTLEAGPTIGWRGWPVHMHLKAYAEISDRHDGLTSELTFSYPLEWSRGYLVPSVGLVHLNKDYADYYYSVTSAESTLVRPAFAAEASTNLALKLRWGYALNEKWLLSGAIGVEQLDSNITDSPIVNDDEIWSARVGLAYNADVFQPRNYDDSAPRMPGIDIRIGAFRDSISTKVARDTSNGVPGFETDIEEFLGIADEETVLQMDATVRLAHYHRLEFGYFELGRNSTTLLSNDFTFGDEVFQAGTSLDTRVDASFLQASYSYSLIRDAQKEFGVTAGVHFANFETSFSSESTGQSEHSDAGTPLPVIGTFVSFFLGERTSVGAKVQLFRTDFDRYEGSLNFAALDVQYRVADAIRVGLGYNYYGMKLSSNDTSVNGYLKVRHHGPTAFFTVGY